MPNIKLNNLIDKILSVNETYHCQNEKFLIEDMASIDFTLETSGQNEHDANNFFIFKGIISEMLIKLRVNQDRISKNCLVIEKYFNKKNKEEMVPHRDDDLPAVIFYDLKGNVVISTYYLNGVFKRVNDLLAPIIVYQNEISVHTYPTVNSDKKEDILIKTITCRKDTVIDIKATFKELDISLDKLVTFIPRIVDFNFDQITNLNKELTHDELTLFHMALI